MTVPLNNLTDTWNAGATVFTGLKLNVTNTASAAGSLLLDFQIGGVSKVSINKTAEQRWNFDSAGDYRAAVIDGGGSTGTFAVYSGGTETGRLAYNGLVLTNSSQISLGSTTLISWNGGDLNITRDAAGILAQRNSTNAQTLRVYNTFTDASNYERGVFDWTTTANTLRIAAEALGTGTQRVIQLSAGGGYLQIGNFAVVCNNNLSMSTNDITGVQKLAANSVLCNGLAVASLPGSPAAGTVCYVTDATATTIGSTVAGGGSNKVMVWYNGTAWHIMAN